MTGRASYGLDAPIIVRNNVILGAAAILAGVTGFFVFRHSHSDLAQSLLVNGAFAAAILIGIAAFMCWSSLVGKFGVRDRVLGAIVWRGDEQVLDIGCGRGLALIGAARRLSSGRAVGIDLWSQVDLSANAADATMANARAEGVDGRITLQTGDARHLPFADGSFDVVLSMTALHNIKDKAGRTQALSEAVRVLAPAGTLAIFDIFKTGEYLAWLRSNGMEVVSRSRLILLWLVPGRILVARRIR